MDAHFSGGVANPPQILRINLATDECRGVGLRASTKDAYIQF